MNDIRIQDTTRSDCCKRGVSHLHRQLSTKPDNHFHLSTEAEREYPPLATTTASTCASQQINSKTVRL